MQIWWGWRLGFDCTLLYSVFYYFSQRKLKTKLHRLSTINITKNVSHLPPISRDTELAMKLIIECRTSFPLPSQEDGTCKMVAKTQTVYGKPLLQRACFMAASVRQKVQCHWHSLSALFKLKHLVQ
jgi:hypothetical protein